MKEFHWRARGKKFWRETRPLLLTILILTAVRSAIADWNDVPSGSMNPTIVEGDRVFVNKLAYDLKVPFTTWHIAQWSNPKRGDIDVFYSPADGIRLVKRVIGLPGDSIELVNDRLFINGVPAGYEPLPSSVGRDLPAKRSFGPVVVPAGHYFMMGDNRDDSNDSRYWGTVDRSRIVGRASMVMMSLDHEHYFVPRWHRFFTELL